MSAPAQCHSLSTIERMRIEYIRDFLIQRLNKFPDLDGKGTNAYYSVEEFVLINGKAVRLTPVETSNMPARRCYANAEAVALRNPGDFFYMEGWAYTDIGNPEIFQHAWVVDAHTGECYDPTWTYPDTVALGCVFPAGYHGMWAHTDEQELTRSVFLRKIITAASVYVPRLRKNMRARDVFSAHALECTKKMRIGSVAGEPGDPSER